LDVVEFKRKNWLRVSEPMHLSKSLGEGREGVEQALQTSALDQCMDIGRLATDFETKREKHRQQDGRYRRGIGMAVVMHGSGIADLDMASATLKMNDDGSFNLLIGATDLGTGSDTILAQMAAEVLGIPLDDVIVYSSDTDFTPFDKGAYASSTTYVSGGAVRKAALKIKEQILEHASLMLGGIDVHDLELQDRQVVAPDGRSISLSEIGLSSLHQQNQHQIIASASHKSPLSPPPTAAQFAEIVVDMETGRIDTERLLMVVDCGRVINPATASGQVEGGMAQALGFALTEEMLFDDDGQPLNPNLSRYRIPRAARMPAMDVIFVQTDEPSGPFGAKSVSEIAIDGVSPAMASALYDATGIWMRELPYTPERVKAALKQAGS
jgi:putative selenate reductase molybdopterin-binding subunit